MIWLIVRANSSQWNYIPAEAPCWKGEINMSFRWASMTIGWQRNEPVKVKEEISNA